MKPARGTAYPTDMDEKELADGLRSEGFRHTYVWQDGPNVFYPDHRHEEETAHIILSGEMTLMLDGQATTYLTDLGHR